jgi:hypothetical protein
MKASKSNLKIKRPAVGARPKLEDGVLLLPDKSTRMIERAGARWTQAELQHALGLFASDGALERVGTCRRGYALICLDWAPPGTPANKPASSVAGQPIAGPALVVLRSRLPKTKKLGVLEKERARFAAALERQ